MSYYKIILPGSVTGRYSFYRVRRGVVEKWQPLSQVWKKSALYSSEEELVRAGAISVKDSDRFDR
jgi:hypothetical protein